MRRLMFVEFAAVGALALAASLGFQRVFAGSGLIMPLVGAVAIPLLITIVGMYRRSSITTTMLWSCLAFFVYTTYAALGETAPNVVPTLTTVRELSRGLTSGWAELLTISLPAPRLAHLTVVPIALAWAASALSAEFAHRSRSTAAPVIPAVVVYLSSLAFAASQPPGTLWLPIAIAASLLVVLLVHANRWAVLEPAGLRAKVPEDDEHDIPVRTRTVSVDTSANRWIVLGLPVVAFAVAAATLIAPRLPTRDGSFDPRSLRDQNVRLGEAGNPLEALKAELGIDPDNPPVRFSVQTDDVDDARTISHLRLAVLDRFDGAGWSSANSFSRAGSELPAGPDLDVATRTVTQQVLVNSLGPGPWLPAADRPVRITSAKAGLEIGVDAESGVIIATTGELSGLDYQVTSEVPQPTEDELEQLARRRPERDVSALIDVPNMPTELREIALRFTEDAATPYQRLLALQRALLDDYAYNEQVPSGSSYGRLTQFLTQDGGGYAEQFASAYATLARSLGFPTRLVYGYLTAEVDPDSGELRTMTDITSRQAHVWPEVLLGGSVWVPFEPTPKRLAAPLPDTAAPVTNPAGGGGVVAPPASGTTGTGDGTAFQGSQPAEPFLLSTPVLALLTLLVAILMLLVALILMKRIRRQRRRRGDSTTGQVLGAWAEVTDRLLEVGVVVDRAMTAKEVVAVSAERVPQTAADRLGVMVPLVTFALYSPIPPTESAAAEMWTHADAFHREVLEGKRWYQGTVALLNPRPLLLNVNRR